MIRPPTPRASRRRRADEGDLEVLVADEQSAGAVDVVRWEALARGVLEAEGVSGEAELALLFPIDDEEVGVGRSPDGSTSGPDRDPFTDVPLLLGDVVICPAVAARNAPTHAGTYDDEIALLVVHGILHVLGWDHATPEETQQMQARERELLDRFAPSAP